MSNFNHTFVTDPEDVARYLEALIEGFRGGELRFTSGDREVRLEPSSILELTIETSARKGKVSLSLNVSWPEPPKPKGPEAGAPGLGLSGK
jgi:amphi-Trp domain-containing protein